MFNRMSALIWCVIVSATSITACSGEVDSGNDTSVHGGEGEEDVAESSQAATAGAKVPQSCIAQIKRGNLNAPECANVSKGGLIDNRPIENPGRRKFGVKAQCLAWGSGGNLGLLWLYGRYGWGFSSQSYQAAYINAEVNAEARMEEAKTLYGGAIQGRYCYEQERRAY